MSKRKTHRLEQARRKLGIKMRKFFELAAAWAQMHRGIKLGRGAILRAETLWRRRSKLIEWARPFVDTVLAPTSFSDLKAA